MSGDPYVYPGTSTLINRFDEKDPEILDFYERLFVARRTDQGVPEGNFDLDHVQSIHHHLFQDLYDWAGEPRNVSLAKGQSVFLPPQYIEQGMDSIHQKLEQRDFLTGMDREEFASNAAEIIGDLNHVHPFREGNGRTQLRYLEQLGEQAGHPVRTEGFEPHIWVEASIAANRGDLAPMERSILVTGAKDEPRHTQGSMEGARPKPPPGRGVDWDMDYEPD